jgi:(1->4)-alpha-D-glucan 1-alpha-D-glucosylmutase
MRHAGAIRIDHAFQLRRLFVIPSGAPASQGAYIDYPFEAMLAVLRLESHRARCLVIAEDLGTAPEGFSDAIMESGVLSYRVLPFEREGAAFKRPEEYPRSALAVITTHDLPTFIGWWRGLDIDMRQTLGVFEPKTAARERLARAADRREFATALAGQNLLPSPALPEEPPVEGAVRYLARTASVLTAVQIEDASGELNQTNMPGMDAGHPNWRRRLSNTIEEIAAPGSLLAKLAVAMTEEGRDARPAGRALASPPPRATYRLQFHKDFTFDDAAGIAPYLAGLGISHAYASPIQAAAPGSVHGYDIVDHTAINPELGGEEGFRRFSEALQAHGLKLLLDIVPNHMGVGGEHNAWWLSVLEWGRLSPHADAFDIDWERPGADGRLIVPFLGSPYGEALEKGELKLAFDADEGASASGIGSTASRSARPPIRWCSTLPWRPWASGARPARPSRSPRPCGAWNRGTRAPPRTEPRRSSAASPRRWRPLRRSARPSTGPWPCSTAPPASPRASTPCTASWNGRPIARPIGGWRRATSTTAASSR